MLRPRTVRFAWLALTTLVIACGTPALRHVSGRELAPEFRFAPIERGWIAVDSCARGIHAVVELEVDSVALRDVPPTLAGIGRALGARRDVGPAVAVDGPFCRYGGVQRRPGAPPSESPATARDRMCAPMYVVRAQYLLRRLPAAGEHVTVMQVDQPIVVTWEVR